jgi:hypothetical protein
MYLLDGTPESTAPAGLTERVAVARDALQARGVAALPPLLSGLLADADPENEAYQAFVVQGLKLILDAFEADPQSAGLYATLDSLAPEAASVLARALVELVLGSLPDLSLLADPHFIALASLLSISGEHERAAILLNEAEISRPAAPVRHAAWLARCRWAQCDADVSRYWPTAAAHDDEAEAHAAIDRQPLNIDAHRSLARCLLARHEPLEALERVSVALSLPVGESDKIACAEELAMAVAVLTVRGERRSLLEMRTSWALASCGTVATRAADLLGDWLADGTLPFTDDSEIALMQRQLRAAARSGNLAAARAAGETPVTAFPLRNGKPHIDTVWLEITNYCNQKCTFCPDMFREDSRTWLPLDKVIALIDELADTISVGSMQLNAYGEPLLHPNIGEILAHIRKRNLPWPTFFTSHGLTLVEKKLKQLSHNYPAGIAISLHNDSQQSYEATRSPKIGDYATMVARISALLRQMALEGAPSHLRLYQMVSNAFVDMRVAEETRAAFPDTPERMLRHVRKWEAIAAEIAAELGDHVEAHVNREEDVIRAFLTSDKGDSDHLRILSWTDIDGGRQEAFMSARPANTYANLLLEYDPTWNVERKLLNPTGCHFTAKPSLAIFATGRLGICCIDLNSTATFGSLSDFASLSDALTSPQALQMFAQISNGVATSRGCQICLGSTERLCSGG